MSGGIGSRDYRKFAAGIACSAILLAGLAAGSYWHRAAKAVGTSPREAASATSARAAHPSLAVAPPPLAISHSMKLAPAPESAVAAPQPAGIAASPANQLVANYGKLPLSFEANQGQASGPVQFLSHGQGYTLFLTGHEAVLALRKPAATGQNSDGLVKQTRLDKLGSFLWPFRQGEVKSKRDSAVPGSAQPLNRQAALPTVLRLQLLGANSQPKVSGFEELPGRSNYFIGNDPKKWRTNIPTYARVRYAGVYPGVDLVYYGNQDGQLEYDFVVAPGADPNHIKLSFAGVDGTRIDEASGDLVLKVGEEEVRFHKPVVYQPTMAAYDRRTRGPKIDSALEKPNPEPRITSPDAPTGTFELASNNEVTFRVARYDPKRSLVIDPVLSYSTYLGGGKNDFGQGIAVDSSGNAYVTGYTASTDFPIIDPLQNGNGGGVYSAFVSKLTADGSGLVYSTYLGGSTYDIGWGIAVDSSGSAYVTGGTKSADFPTVNPIQATCHQCGVSGSNAFVSKLSADGSALVYSTFLGGGGDAGTAIAVDSSGNAYVTGYTVATDFPTVNAFQATCSGCTSGSNDAFVAKLKADGSALVYSTYLGGSQRDDGLGIAVDSSGSAYVTGLTYSTDFPTVNPIQAACEGCLVGLFGYDDAFVTKLNATGSALVYSTYLGGSYADQGNAIAVDSSGNAYVTGSTYSINFPTVKPIQATCGTGECIDDAFVAKVNAAGSALVYSTYLGGSTVNYGYGFGIAVDSSGNAYVTGITQEPDFPTVNAFQGTCASCTSGGLDAFVAELKPDGSALVYSSYLGGSNGSTEGNAIALDSSGAAYVTGTVFATDFPLVNAIQTTCGGCTLGYYDAFVAKISSGGGGGGGTPGCGCSKTGNYVAPNQGSSPAATSSKYTTNTFPSPPNGNAYTLTVTNSSGAQVFNQSLPAFAAYGFSPDGGRLLVNAPGQGVSVYNLVSSTPGQSIGPTPLIGNPGGVPSSIQFSPSGQYLAYTALTGSSVATLQIYNVLTGKKVYENDFSFQTIPGSGTAKFGAVGDWGFGPDTPETSFTYTYLTGQGSPQLEVVHLEQPPGVNTNGFATTVSLTDITADYAEFSPCGDVLAIVTQPSNVDIKLLRTLDGTQVKDTSGLPVASYTLSSTSTQQIATYSGTQIVLADDSQYNLGCSSQNMPAGANVTVQPPASGTAVSGTLSAPVTLNFPSVNSPGGQVSLGESGTGSAPPSGFELGSPAVYFDLTISPTTLGYTGPVTICINYTGITFAGNGQPVLDHIVNGSATDITKSVDKVNNIICGSSPSLSPFAIFGAAGPVSTTTALTSSLNPVVAGQAVTFTAQVSPSLVGTPTGTVTFSDGGSVLGTVALDASATVSFSTSSLVGGSHLITAQYSGDASFVSSISTAFTQVVSFPAGQISISATGLLYSRVSKTFSGTVTIKNIGSGALRGPFQMVLTGLPSGVTLNNATGTFNGSPYITSNASLAAGQSATVSIQFSDPSMARIAFTPVVHSGTF